MNNLTPLGKLIIIGIIILILVGVGILVWFWTRPAEEPTDETPATTEAVINGAISEYDFSMREYETVDKIKALGLEGVPYLCEIVRENGNEEARFIAYVSLSGLGLENNANQSTVLPCLREGLNDTDDSLRAQAAQLLLNFGEKDGLAVLIEYLDDSSPLIPSEPPMNINEWASLVLADYTDADFGMDREEWQAWWDENKDTLKFDLSQQKFSL